MTPEDESSRSKVMGARDAMYLFVVRATRCAARTRARVASRTRAIAHTSRDPLFPIGSC
jgi:hypothetical protein